MEILDARFGAFLFVASLLIVTPGPDTALVTRNALVAGRRAASYTTWGIGIGSIIWALASVLGIALLLEQSVVAFTIFKLGGAAYLLYLGFRTLVATYQDRNLARSHSGEAPASSLSPHHAFGQGLLNNVSNPKAGAIFATALPQFISPGDSVVRLLVMLLAYEAILLGWLHFYGYLVSRAGQSRLGAKVRTVLQGFTGVVLIALGVRLAFEQQ